MFLMFGLHAHPFYRAAGAPLLAPVEWFFCELTILHEAKGHDYQEPKVNHMEVVNISGRSQ